MPFIIPQIVYPASAPTTFFSPTYPPVEKPGTDDLNTIRADSVTLSGRKQTLWFRTDTFKHLMMKSVPQSEIVSLWQPFMAYALQGGSFLYYPDVTQTAFDEWVLEASGGSAPSSTGGGDAADAWSPTYSFRGISEFELIFRKVVGGLSSP